MLLRTLIAVMVLGLLLVACTTDKESNDNSAAEPPASETDTAADADTGSDETTSADTDETTGGDTDPSGGGAADLLGSVSPFDLLGGLEDASLSGDIDPELKKSLLDADDMPSGFFPLGEFSFTTASDFGDMELVANMFMSGDLASTDFGSFSMVMSAAILLPPEAVEELGSIDDLESLIASDFDDFEEAAGEFGEFADIELLDASGLGDGGFGMHIEMDFGALFAGFGVPEDELEATGLAMDMYVFFEGEQMLMVVTMWPTGEPAEVDAYELAQRMAGK